MRAGRVLRLRKDDLVRLTYKDNSQNIKGALSRREIEFVADDFDSAKQFIEALGYEVVFVYEKYRTTFDYKENSHHARRIALWKLHRDRRRVGNPSTHR